MDDTAEFLFLLFIGAVLFCLGLGTGFSNGERAVEKQAVERGYAEYRVDSSKEVVFVWKEAK